MRRNALALAAVGSGVGELESANWSRRTGFGELDSENRLSAPGRIRTSDTWFRKPVLYPLSYEGGIAIDRW